LSLQAFRLAQTLKGRFRRNVSFIRGHSFALGQRPVRELLVHH
jgi:hypothetical protein